MNLSRSESLQVTPSDAAAPAARAAPGAGRFLVRLALELIVVFVGVYAAFALSEYESRRDAADRRQQLQSALVREIQDITSNTRRVARALPVELARFDSAVVAGAQPRLQPWIEPVRVHTHMWESTLQSGGVNLFDVATVYELSRFYNELNAGFEQLTQLRSLSETVLIPTSGRAQRNSTSLPATDYGPNTSGIVTGSSACAGWPRASRRWEIAWWPRCSPDSTSNSSTP